ncbi:sulfite exporter TauE/SafE family protein [Shimia sp. NS0008-38b]|uniref:sulfite exporter TauE/SafE family protein n=1 Tax=Shimia sp. NS0008-38b TaxID=3127653 RepID=UPI00310AAAA2
MTDSITFWVLAPLAVVFAGVSKAGFGSGAAFASAALLAIILPPTQALGLMLPLLMLIDLVTLRPYWGLWSWPEARILIVGGVGGVIAGVVLFNVASDDALRFLIGSVSLGFVAWQLWPRKGSQKPMPLRAGVIAGAVAGFTSFVSHAGGPPAAVYLLSRGLSKTAFQATTVLVFWALNLAKSVPYAMIGVFQADTLRMGALLAPFALLGAYLGIKLHHAVSERAFFTVTYVFLTVTGMKLIFDALS